MTNQIESFDCEGRVVDDTLWDLLEVRKQYTSKTKGTWKGENKGYGKDTNHQGVMD